MPALDFKILSTTQNNMYRGFKCGVYIKDPASSTAYLADILLNTALKAFKLRANNTLEAKLFNCRTYGVSDCRFRN